MMITGLLFNPLVISAQDDVISEIEEEFDFDNDTSEEVDDEQTSEESNDESDFNTEVIIAPNNIYFEQLIPYAQFINYQYSGDGSAFEMKDIIMEYAPDNNGVFQVAAYSGQNAIAYVYQIRDSGFYELASFADYYVVEDLRYSPDATDGLESLILPSNLTVGSTYSTGYNNETVRIIAEQIDDYTIGSQIFNGVLRVEEYKQEAEGAVLYNHYFAPTYGLIVVEKVNPDGSTHRIMQLISAQVYLE